MAGDGFNICIISRNKKKIDSKLEEIKERYPKAQTKGIVCDFSKLTSMQQYNDLVAESGLDELDIGVLCLNAGIGTLAPIDLASDESYEAVWNVNGLQVVYLLKALTKKLLARDQRSAVLITSSMAAEMILAG